LAGKAEAACEKHTKKLGEEMRRFSYSEEVIALLRPAPTQDLLDAIASTNTVADAEAGDKGKGEKTKKAAEARDPMAPPEPALRPAASSRAAAEFRPPTEDEADPMSPAHAEYLKEKKKWEEARKNAPPEPEPAPEVVLAVPDGGPQVKVPAVVSDVHELWERAYTCRACEIRLNAKIAQLNAKIDAAMKLAGGDSEAELRAVADQSRACKEDFDSLLASKDYETLRKGSSWIESRGQKVVKRETDRMITEKGIATREQEKKDREAQDRLRKERQEKEHAELVEKEIAAAKASFAKVIDNRNLKLLDWAGGLRMIRDVGQDFNTSEGDLELTKQLKKVEAMKLFHDIMIRNLKGYTFARGGKNSLKGMTVVEVDEQTLSYKKKEAVRAKTIQWVKFYRDYHTNLNELLNRFVRNGRANGEPKLNLKEWAEAMIGASLTLQIVCDDDPSAVAYGEQLIKEMVKQFPNFLGRAKESFPTIDFSDVASEVESGEF
jgi:hypothetical protein